MADKTAPSLSALVTNWRNCDAPFFTKLKLFVQNSMIKIRQRSNCCGHPGEPGC
jgi:hypothetical protein